VTTISQEPLQNKGRSIRPHLTNYETMGYQTTCCYLWTHMWLGQSNYAYLLLPALILYLFKPRLLMSIFQRWLKMGWVLSSYSCSYHVINLSLPFTMSLYLVDKGEWPDLTCGIPGFCPWDIKLWFQISRRWIGKRRNKSSHNLPLVKRDNPPLAYNCITIEL
jgi:hypothetical protein